VGPDSNVNEVIPTLMDVMKAHDIHVAFYVEPYTDDHARNYARDVLYLIKNYGDRRHWDCFLLHEYEDATTGPVFKSFRTILPDTSTDCHGVTTADCRLRGRRCLEAANRCGAGTLRHDFDRVTLHADSLHVGRTRPAGSTASPLFDNYVAARHVAPARRQLHGAREPVVLLSGQPRVRQHRVSRIPSPTRATNRRRFRQAAASTTGPRSATAQPPRTPAAGESPSRSRPTVALQTSAALSNAKRGFFLVYINFVQRVARGASVRAMKDRANLTNEERALGYHNPDNGRYRLDALRDLVQELTA
jgi:hypothetical protein